VAWRAIVHSAIGTRHCQLQQPCQDYGDYRIAGNILLGAVSDGAGSAKYSDIGAKVAVETALAVMAEQVLQGVAEMSYEAISTTASDFLLEMFKQVISALEMTAQKGDYELRDLGCTLLAFMAAPDWIAAAQIGDGFIVAGDGETHSYRLLFPPDKGEFINETMFITTGKALDYLQVCVHQEPAPFVCAATDGLERVAIRFQDWQPHPPFFQPFVACLSQLDMPDERQAYLETFLASERLNTKTDDDKTLLACLYQPQGGE
jgi:Protein phosphatase 2C